MTRAPSPWLLEQALHRWLALDPGHAARVEALGECKLGIRITPPDWCWLVWTQGRKLRLQATASDEDAQGWLEGSLTDFVQMLSSADPQAALINGPLRLRGQSQGFVKLFELLQERQPDWEHLVASCTGDLLAGPLVQFAGKLRHWRRHLHQSWRRNLRDWLEHDSGLLAPTAAMRRQHQEIKELAAALQRLTGRLTAETATPRIRSRQRL